MKNTTLFLRKGVLHFILSVCLPLGISASVIYVTPSGAGNHKGTSWSNACTLTEAASNTGCYDSYCGSRIAVCGDEIWLKQGTYSGDAARPGYAFVCNVYGGFAGNETLRTQRNSALYITKITNQDNRHGGWYIQIMGPCASYNVDSNDITLDGIFFENDSIGLLNGNLHIDNGGYDHCTLGFTSHILYEWKVFTALNTVFKNSIGLYIAFGGAAANFEGCTFTNMGAPSLTSRFGGGAVTSQPASNFLRCKFDNCRTGTFASGGAIWTAGTTSISNCLFTNCRSDKEGGAVFAQGGSIKMCTFVNDSSGTNYGHSVYSTSYPTTISNCIFWSTNDKPGLQVVGILPQGNGFVSRDNSLGAPIDPLFTADYQLSNCSPLIDFADTTRVGGQKTDLAGNKRIANGKLDLGCYEHAALIKTKVYITSPQSMPLCNGYKLGLQVGVVGNPTQYDWYKNGSLFSTTTGPSISNIPVNSGDKFTVKLISPACDAISDTFTVSMQGPILANIGVACTPQKDAAICPGTPITIHYVYGSSGGSCAEDQVYYYAPGTAQPYGRVFGGTIIDTRGAYGQITLSAWRNDCRCGQTAINILAKWSVKPAYPADITIVASKTAIAPGGSVTFHSAVTNAGSIPKYSWLKNGDTLGVHTANYTTNNINSGDQFSCVLTPGGTSNICISTTTDTSNMITIYANSTRINAEDTCIGSPITTTTTFTPALTELVYNYHQIGERTDSIFPRWNTLGNVNGVMPGFNNTQAVWADFNGKTYLASGDYVAKFTPGSTSATIVAGGHGTGSAANQLNGASGVAFYNDTLYVSDYGNNRVTKWYPGRDTGVVVAGGHGAGSASNQLNGPSGIYVSGGYLYIADSKNHRVQRIAPNGFVLTVAGGNGAGSADNQFNTPVAVAFDIFGIYVLDALNDRVQYWTGGIGHTIAGGNGRGNAVNQINDARGMAIDGVGNVFLAETGAQRITRWRAGLSQGTTLVNTNATVGSTPVSMWVSTAGRMYASFPDFTVREYSTIPDTLTANVVGTYQARSYPFGGGIDFPQPAVSNTISMGTRVSPGISIYADRYTGCVGGNVNYQALALNGGDAPGYQWYINGTMTGGNAPFLTATTDYNDTVKCVLTSSAGCATPDTAVSNKLVLLAPSPAVKIFSQGDGVYCEGSTKTFTAVATDGGEAPYYEWYKNGQPVGNNVPTYEDAALQQGDEISCWLSPDLICSGALVESNHITTSLFTAGIGGDSCINYPAPTILQPLINGGLALQFNWQNAGQDAGSSIGSWSNVGSPVPFAGTFPNNFSSVISDRTGNVYTLTQSAVKMWSPVTQITTVVAGQEFSSGSSAAELLFPSSCFVDGDGNIYVADNGNNRVQKWSPGATEGLTVAGGNGRGNSGAQLNGPAGICVDDAGNVFVADQGNNRIQKWAPGSSAGVTVAGGYPPFNIDPALVTFSPIDVIVDHENNVYVLEQWRVTKWAAGAGVGVTIAGQFFTQGSGSNQLNTALGMSIDDAGNLYVADMGNHRIQMWARDSANAITVAGGNGAGSGPDQFNYPTDVAVDHIGNMYVADNGNNRVQHFVYNQPAGNINASTAGFYTLTATSTAGCSVMASYILNQPPTPTIEITADDDSVCPGTPITFNTILANAGNSPDLLWYRNGNPAFTGPQFTTVLDNNDIISCHMHVNGCSLPHDTFSNYVTVHVTATDTPFIGIYSDQANVICPGTPITFNAVTQHAGSSPGFLWIKNGMVAGTDSSYTGAGLQDGDIIYCILNNNNPCAIVPTSFSAPDTIRSGNLQPVAAAHHITLTLDVNGTAPVTPYMVDALSYTTCGTLSLSLYKEAVGSVCNTADENETMTLTAPAGMVFTSIDFASYGNASGICGSFESGSCHSPSSLSVVQNALLGRNSGSIQVENTTFGGDPCSGSPKQLTIQASYSPQTQLITVDCDDIGDNNVVLLATNSLGNVSAAISVITVRDITPPTALAKNTTVYLNANGTATINAALIDNGSSDVCSPVHFSVYGEILGTICATLNEQQQQTLTAPAGMVFTSIDFASFGTPDGSCGSFTTNASCHAASSAAVVGNILLGKNSGTLMASNDSFGDPCFGTLKKLFVQASYSAQTPVTSFNCSNAGGNEVMLMTEDESGNRSSAIAIITVRDTTRPLIIAPADNSFTADPGSCYYSGTIDTATATDNCQVTITRNPLGPYSTGTTLVKWIATDAAGNKDSCLQAIHVATSLRQNISVGICPGSTYDFNGQLLFAAGIYRDTINSSMGCDSIVILSLSVLTVYSTSFSAEICAGETYWFNGTPHTATGNFTETFTAHNGCDSVVTLNLSVLHAYSSSFNAEICNGEIFYFNGSQKTTSGTYIETFTAVNGCDSVVTLSLSIRPGTSCPDNVSKNADAGSCSAIVSVPSPVTPIGCSIQSLINDFTNTANANGTYPVGSTTVRWTVVNINGSTLTCNQTVNITDNQVPTITCQGNIAITADQTGCNKLLTVTSPTVNDNCGVASVKNSINNTNNASGIYSVGTINIAWTVKDLHDLSNTCNQSVTIYPCIQITGSPTNTTCPGVSSGSLVITVNGGHGSYSYHWSSGQTTANISNLSAGNYTVTVNDQSQGTATATFTIGTIVPAAKPATPGAIIGPAKFCKNVTNTYSISSVPLASSYNWIAPPNSTIISGQGTTQVAISFLPAFTNGTLSVLAINCLGSSAKSNLAVAIFALPTKPASVSGPLSVCKNTVQGYSAPALSGPGSYVWTVPANATLLTGQGTNTITVQFGPGFSGGDLSVYGSNCIGNGAKKTITIAAQRIPGKPSQINGATGVCPVFEYQYSVTAVAGVASYTWTVPANATFVSGQGTNSIIIRYSNSFTSGNITVFAANCAGNSPVQTRAITKSTSCGVAKTEDGQENSDKVQIIDSENGDVFMVNASPNPFTDRLYITIKSPLNLIASVELFDVTGKLILQRNDISDKTEIIIGKNLEPGLYLLRIHQGSKTRVLRLIKSL